MSKADILIVIGIGAATLIGTNPPPEGIEVTCPEKECVADVIVDGDVTQLYARLEPVGILLKRSLVVELVYRQPPKEGPERNKVLKYGYALHHGVQREVQIVDKVRAKNRAGDVSWIVAVQRD